MTESTSQASGLTIETFDRLVAGALAAPREPWLLPFDPDRDWESEGWQRSYCRRTPLGAFEVIHETEPGVFALEYFQASGPALPAAGHTTDQAATAVEQEA